MDGDLTLQLTEEAGRSDPSLQTPGTLCNSEVTYKQPEWQLRVT